MKYTNEMKFEPKVCVFSMWSAPRNIRNWVLCDYLLGYATVLTLEEVFSVWSVPRLYNEVPKYLREFIVEEELEVSL
jgi:hypothetical protein